MAHEPDNIILAYLRAIRAELQTVGRDVAEMNGRMGRLEVGLAQTQVAIAEQSVRIDGMDDRLRRIERRLDLADAPPTVPGRLDTSPRLVSRARASKPSPGRLRA